jgi:hypothetical protein
MLCDCCFNWLVVNTVDVHPVAALLTRLVVYAVDVHAKVINVINVFVLPHFHHIPLPLHLHLLLILKWWFFHCSVLHIYLVHK